MKTCREVTRLFSEGMERDLSLLDRAQLKMHCMMCSGCRHFGEQMQQLRFISKHFVKAGSTSSDGNDSSNADS